MSLIDKIDKSRIPAHVAIIMDGNGRWAKEHGFERSTGHENGVTTVRRITETGAILDEALMLPAPEDRAACESRAASLERQIAEIGPVNEVAMDEYTKLKERADYIVEQVDDLERARTALRRISR